jgi:hypothetical protein
MMWLKRLFSRRRLYGDLSDEIREHLEEKLEELVASGLPRKEAAAAARREFGNVTFIEESSREVLRWPSIESFLVDMRYGLRMLRKNPGAIFTVINAVMLRALPVQHPEQLVSIGDPTRVHAWSTGTPRTNLFSYPLCR